MIARAIVILAAFAVVLSIPYAIRPAKEVPPEDALQLVMISPHIEAIQYEFGRAFRDWHEAKYGRPVVIDWRNIGGTSELARYIESEFAAAFKFHWTRTLGKPWSAEAAAGFNNDPKPDAPAVSREARETFLASDIGIGLDVFFGGGSFDHDRAARRGYLVDSGLAKAHPEWLGPENIPQTLGGEVYYDKQGRWYGACLTTFGICYNRDSLKRLGIEKAPTEWADLADPRYFLQIGLADPTKSGSIAKAFEMIIQQQMHQEVEDRKAAAGPAWDKRMEKEAVAAGWDRAMRLIQRIAANGRYFTEGASSVVTDVADGNAAAGMSIDYYTRFSAESVATADGESRLQFVTPIGGTSVSADPVAMFRGAPHPEVARHFIEFVVSEDGQKLWNYKVGTPGGPIKYALRRLPIRKDMYAPPHRQYMSDPEEEPYKIAAMMTYRPEWTGALFNFLRPYIQSMVIEPHAELRAAWRAILEAGGPETSPEATRQLGEMPLAYEQAAKQNVADPFSRMALTRGWAEFFKKRYEAAERTAVRPGGTE